MNAHAYIALDVAHTSRAIDAMLAAYPELAEDGDLRLDMLDGETNLVPMLSRLVRMRQETLAEAEGLNTYITDLLARRDRMARKADGFKALMLDLMTTAQLPKLALPEATLSIRAGNTSVQVTDVDALPQGFYATERKPLKTEIKKALQDGAEVPGACLVTGDDLLTVRVK